MNVAERSCGRCQIDGLRHKVKESICRWALVIDIYVS
jgi:hypothetical protein